MNTTVRMKASQITKDWHVIDAAGRPLGRVATEVATLLRGKHKPTYEPHLDDGDFVIVINASQVRLTGNKSSHMKYRRHSGYPGGLRERSFTEQLARHPDRVIEQAVWGMLPSGPLAEAMFKHLKVYAGSNHPHQSQIVGTQRAQEARAEATTSAGPVAYRPKSLRPVGGQQPAAAEPAAEPEPVAEAEPAPRRRLRRTRAEAPAEAAQAASAPVEPEPAAEAPVEPAAAADVPETDTTTAEAADTEE